MADGIIGFCRFSFLGLGDWIAYRNLRGAGGKISDEVLAEVAAKIYDPTRLALRFWLFENLLLPSIKAQEDQDFTLVVLTSPEMPAEWLDRLRTSVADVPTVRVLVSEARSCRDALVPEVARFRDERGGGGFPVQFRIDDDDCLAVGFTRMLRIGASRMKGFKSYAVTMPEVLVLSAYGDAPPRFYRQFSPFHSAGCAYYTENPGNTVFTHAHTLLPRKVASLTLPGHSSALATKFDGHDAEGLFLRNRKRDLVEVEDADFRAIAARRFPFLETLDFAPAQAIASGAVPA